MNTFSEFFGLSVDWLTESEIQSAEISTGNRCDTYRLGLHPQQIGVRCEFDSSVDGALGTALVSVEALPSSRGIPVPVRQLLQTELFLSYAARFVVGSVSGTRDLGEECLDPVVGNALLFERFGQSVRVQRQGSLRSPLVLDFLEGGSAEALLLSSTHNGNERLELGIRGTEDEGVISFVNVR